MSSSKQASSSKVFTCFIPRPDYPDILYKTLKDAGIKLDIADQRDTLPRDQVLNRVKGKDALVCMHSPTSRVDDELLDAAGPQLKVIATTSVGYDHVDVEAVKKRGIKFGNTPGVLTDAVAELTVGLLLATTRRFFEAHRALAKGEWNSKWGFLTMCGISLKDKTVGFVGMGRIAFATLKRLIPFGVKEFFYFARRDHPEANESGAKKLELDDMLSRSDIVIVLCALTDETFHLINKDKFSKMKKGAILVNTARGPIVDQKALYDALVKGHLGAAGLDVMEKEPIPIDDALLKLPNVTLLPHIGSAVVETRIAMARLTADNIVAGLRNEPMPAQVC